MSVDSLHLGAHEAYLGVMAEGGGVHGMNLSIMSWVSGIAFSPLSRARRFS